MSPARVALSSPREGVLLTSIATSTYALLYAAAVAKQTMGQPRRRRRPPPATDATDRTPLNYAFGKVGREILAYLQYTITCDQPVEFFLDSVVFHFRKSFEWDVHRTEVENKLNLLWQYSRCPNRAAKGWREDLHRGIDAFPRLGDDRIAWVQARAIELEAEPKQTPRVLRSGLQTPSPARIASKKRLATLKTHGRRKAQRAEITNSVSKVCYQFSVIPFVLTLL